MATTKRVECARCKKMIDVPLKWCGNRKYCPKCSKEVLKERKREAYAKEKERKKKRKEKPAPHVSQIDNLAAAARVAGMSYGRYVALKGAGMV